MKLNLGSGGIPLKQYGYIDVDIVEEWENVDVIADVRDLWMFEDECASEVFGKDILEHMRRSDWRPALDEWVRVLRPGGLLKIRFPNMEYYFRAHERGSLKPPGWNSGKKYTDDYVKRYSIEKLARALFGQDDFPENEHRCGLTWWLVADHLKTLGMKVLTTDGFVDGNEQRITASKGEPDPEISMDHPDYTARDEGYEQEPWPEFK